MNPSDLSAKTLARAGAQLHYWTGGREGAPWVVMIHGATIDHRTWLPQVPALLPHYRLLLVDTRGHGQSCPAGDAPAHIDTYVDDLTAILDQEGIAAAVFVGQSMGGYITQHMVRRHPQRVGAAVILGATPLRFAMSALEWAALQTTPGLFRIWPFDHLVRVSANNSAEHEGPRAYMREAMTLPGKSGWLYIWKAVLSAPRKDGYPDLELGVPSLLVNGVKDRTGTVARDMPLWGKVEANSRYTAIPDAGHVANMDQPEVFNRLLLEFLQGLDR